MFHFFLYCKHINLEGFTTENVAGSTCLTHSPIIRGCSMHSIRRTTSEQQINVTLMEHFVASLPCLMQNDTNFLITKASNAPRNTQTHTVSPVSPLSSGNVICLYPLLVFALIQPFVLKTYLQKSYTKKYLDDQNIQNEHRHGDGALDCALGLQTHQAHSCFRAGSLHFHFLIIPLKPQRCYSADKHTFNHLCFHYSPNH